MHAARASERGVSASVSRLLGIVTYALTRSHCLSLSLTRYILSLGRRRKSKGKRSFVTAAVVGPSVDGSWPFICIANYEKEKEEEDDYEEGTKMRPSAAPATSAFVARCQLRTHNCARWRRRRSSGGGGGAHRARPRSSPILVDSWRAPPRRDARRRRLRASLGPGDSNGHILLWEMMRAFRSVHARLERKKEGIYTVHHS